MKNVLLISPVFTPGAAGVGTLNFSATGITDIRKVVYVENITRGNVIIYAAGPGYGVTLSGVSGFVLTLSIDTSGYNAGDLLQVIVDRAIPEVTLDIPDGNDEGLPMRQIPSDSWRAGFSEVGSGLISSKFSALSTGSGMAISQANGNLLITTGTTASSETLLMSARTFKNALIARCKFQLSQRIVNQLFGFWVADLVGTGLAYTVDGSGLNITVTIPLSVGITTANIGQSMQLSAISGTGTPGRYAITAVSGTAVTFSPIWSATWSRSTTTATLTLVAGGGSEIIAGQAGAVTNSTGNADTSLTNGAYTVVATTGTTFTLTTTNAGAASGTATYQNTAMTFAPSSSGTLTAWGWNAMRALYRDTTATTALFDSQRYGWGAMDTGATTQSTATGTVLQIQTDGTLVTLDDALTASTTSQQVTSRATRIENIPDDTLPLYFFIQARNMTSVPASTTTLTIGFAHCEVNGNVKVFLAGATQNGAARSMSVQVASGTITTVSTVTAVTALTTLNQIATIPADSLVYDIQHNLSAITLGASIQ